MWLCYLRPVHFSRELLGWRLPDAREKIRLLSGRLWNIVLLQGLCLMSAPIFIPRVDSVCDVFVRCLVFDRGFAPCSIWRSMFRLSFWSCCGSFVLSFVMVVAWRWFPASVLRCARWSRFSLFSSALVGIALEMCRWSDGW